MLCVSFLGKSKTAAKMYEKETHTPIHSSLESKIVNKISGKKLFELKMLCNYNNKQTKMCTNSSQKEFYVRKKIFES